MRLITIPLSHYCERARWALERAGIAFREERHLQFLHRPFVKLAGGNHTVPVLCTGDRVLDDSAEIVRFAHQQRPDAGLYPGDAEARREVEALEDDLAGELGVETRRVAYGWFLKDRALVDKYNGTGAPWLENVGLKLSFPVMSRIASRYVGLHPEQCDRGLRRVRAKLDEIGERLSDGRRYLCGDTFTAADLTFASMAAPVLGPVQYGVPLPSLDEMAPDARRIAEELRATPAGAFVLKVYETDRATRL